MIKIFLIAVATSVVVIIAMMILNGASYEPREKSRNILEDKKQDKSK